MRFSHIADCHIGGWREAELRELGLKSFEKAIDISINRCVDFILISGDLFDNAMPSIDLLKEVAGILKRLKDLDIRVYIIAGSHDFSASGKTMIDVFEKAGLVNNVVKFDIDNKLKVFPDKSGAVIAGYLGKRAGLEQEDYKELKVDVSSYDKYKIFMFHSGIEEFKPDDMDKVECLSKNLLPAGFDYYAGGHIHYRFNGDKIVFPGPIFPNNFKELCELRHGSFIIVDNGKIEEVELKLKNVESIEINVDGKSAEDAQKIIEEELKQDFSDKILCLRVAGILDSGKPGDIDFPEINCYSFLKNISKLSAKEFEQGDVQLDLEAGVEEIEQKIIDDNKEQLNLGADVIKKLMDALSAEKIEGEKNSDFETRLLKGVLDVFEQNKTE